jgi:hypothetical protein
MSILRVLPLAVCLFLAGLPLSTALGQEPSQAQRSSVPETFPRDSILEERILALNPDRISDQEVREVLSRVPAPRIINLHGGVTLVYLAMESFSKFLIAMGYPEEKIRHPAGSAFSYSGYTDSAKLAGIIAWHYEREGMRPILVGHSQGGFQVIKVLHELAGTFSTQLPVWNPVTDGAEPRTAVRDPLTGAEQPVVGLRIGYASAVGAGGWARLLPTQWSMSGRLRSIPDSVEQFTGFFIGLDLLGGDLFGLAPTNTYRANGIAAVRNVRLPADYNHVTVPVTAHLAEDPQIRDWINVYLPSERPVLDRDFNAPSDNILWAADVWHGIKKQWCLEAQRWIRAKRPPSP